MAKGSIKSASKSTLSGAPMNMDDAKNFEREVSEYAQGLALLNKKKAAELEQQLNKLYISRQTALNKKMIKDLEDEKEKLGNDTLKKRQEYEKMLQEKADKEALENAKKMEDELAKYKKEQNSKVAQANAKATEVANKIMDSKIGAQAVKAVGNVTSAISKGAEEYMGLYSKYMSKIDARVQGAGKGFNFQAMTDVLSRNISGSPYIKYSDTLENLSKLVEEGVADNVVQRAFLETIKDKIATTFDVMDKNLLQLVRIQQRDSTAARLGMEASLTRLFNYYFSDTSYLSNAFDTVSANLMDLSAQLGDQASVEMEYIVQKWLGALGSVGVSDSTLGTLAEGITYLGTGNVDALSGNEALQNLLVMSANRAGLDYSSLLTGGVSSAQVNALLQSVISYVQDIANSGNNVVKQQYAQLFGISITDMKAFQNLSDEVIKDLYASGMTYKDTLVELNSQLAQVGKRTHISELVDNMFDNILATTGISIASNAGLYGTYKAASVLESITGGIELPFISALGTGIDLNMSLEGLIKGGILGIGTVASLISGIGNLFSGTDALGKFDASGQSSRWYVGMDKGGGFSGYQNLGELSTTKSSTGFVSSGSELGIQQSLSDEQKQTGKDVQGEETSESDEILTILRFIQSYFQNGGTEDEDIEKALRVRVVNSFMGTSNIGDDGFPMTGR